jgi:uncharacterized protein (DUF488 family)
MQKTHLFTIGFTQKTARAFFEALRAAGVRRVIDVRLNNTSQLAAFSKRDDMEYFLAQIGGIEYVHVPELAPTQEILDAYKKHKGSWAVYESAFRALLKGRGVERTLKRAIFDRGCLLCSEVEPAHCHRRLVAEHLEAAWGNVEVEHL